MEGSKELLGDRTSTSLGKEFKSGWWSQTIAVHPARTLFLTTMIPLVLAACVVLIAGDLDLDLMFDGFIESDHFSHNREVGRRGTNPLSEAPNPYIFSAGNSRKLSQTAYTGDIAGAQSVVAARNVPTWRILLMYEVHSNILTAFSLDIVRRFEQRIYNTTEYQELCMLDGSLPVPIASFIQYTSPTISGDTIIFDGLNATTLTPDRIGKAFPYAMQSSSKIRWVFGDDLDYENQSTKLLRSEIVLGSPISGYSYGTPESKQEHVIRREVMKLRDEIRDLWKPFEESGITLYWGGDIVTEREAFEHLIDDSRWAWVSLALIFVIVLFMLKSLFVASFCIFVLLLSFPASVLIYNLVFQQTYFGALNVLSFYIMLGIGVDDIFVYSTTFIFARRPPSAPRAGIIVSSPAVKATDEERMISIIDDQNEEHRIVFNQDEQVLSWYHEDSLQIESLQKMIYMRPGVLVLGTWNVRLRPEYVTPSIKLRLAVMCKIAGVDTVGLPKKKEWGSYGRELASTLMSDVIPLADTATVEQGVVKKNHDISGSLDVRQDDGIVPLDQRVAYTNRKAGLALLVTSSTSTAAFLSGLVTSIPAVRSFGILMAILIVMNLITAMTIMPSLWAYWVCYVRQRSASNILWTHWYLFTMRSHLIDLSDCLILAPEGLEISQSQPSTPSMAVGEVVHAVPFTPERDGGLPPNVSIFPDFLDCEDDHISNDICDDVHQATALARSTDALFPRQGLSDDEKSEVESLTNNSTQPLPEQPQQTTRTGTAPDDDDDDDDDSSIISNTSGEEVSEVLFEEPMLFRIVGLQGALIRLEQSLTSDEVAELNTGDEVLVSEIIRNRARITAPYTGWISVMSEVAGGAILGEVEDEEETEEELSSDNEIALTPRSSILPEEQSQSQSQPQSQPQSRSQSPEGDDVQTGYAEHGTDPGTNISEESTTTKPDSPPTDRTSESDEFDGEGQSNSNDPIIRQMCDKYLWPFLRKFAKPLVILSGTLFLMAVVGCGQLQLSDNPTQIFPSGHRIEKYRNRDTLYGTTRACMERAVSNRCAPWSYEPKQLSHHTSCAGVLYGSDKLDPCGVCNGNGETCRKCDGTFTSDKVWACGSCVLSHLAKDTCIASAPQANNILKLEIKNKNSDISALSCADINTNEFTRSELSSAFGTDFSIAESILDRELPVFGGTLRLIDVSCLSSNAVVQIIGSFFMSINYIPAEVNSLMNTLQLATVSSKLKTELIISDFSVQHGPEEKAIGFDIFTAPPVRVITPTPPPISRREAKTLTGSTAPKKCNAFHTGSDCTQCLSSCTDIGGRCESNGLCRLCDQSLVSIITTNPRRVDPCGICGPDESGTWGGNAFGKSCANQCPAGQSRDDCGECGGNNLCKINAVNAIDTSTIEVSLLWGVDAANSKGILNGDSQQAVYDTNFNAALPTCQAHLASVCSYAKTTPLSFLQLNTTVCFMDLFRDWVHASGHKFPVAEEIFAEQVYRFLRSSSGLWDTYTKYVGFDSNNRITFIEFKFRGTVKVSAGARELKDHYDSWEEEVKYLNSPGAAVSCVTYQTSASWPDMFLEINALNSLVYSLCLAGLVAFGVVLVFLGDFWLTFFVMSTMLASMVATLAVFWTARWEVGPLEAVAVSVVIGIAVDYCVHLAHAWGQLWEYLNRNGYHDASREVVVHRIVVDLGLPLLAAAATTIGSTALLLACTIVPLTKFGLIMVISSTWSMLFSFFLFLPLLLALGPSVCWRRRSEFVRRVASIILGVAFLGSIIGLITALDVTMDETN